MTDFDVAIIGAGIAGASIAAELCGHHRILLLEAESYPGYHSTGRSAAFWSECYGGPGVQPLTKASGPFLAHPDKAFCETPLMSRRGALHIGTAADQPIADDIYSSFADSDIDLQNVDAEFISGHVGGIGPQWNVGIWEPDCCDIDVAALHAAYLRAFKRGGGRLACDAALNAAQYANGAWKIETSKGEYSAKLIVNAAGAWADQVAMHCGMRPKDIIPHRRSIAVLAVDPAPPAALPLIIGLDGSFYFKPDNGGKIWLSPHDETPVTAGDAAPEELDIAKAIDRLQQIVDWNILKLEHKWAGLRNFAPDRLPVIGPDADNPAFFWMAGQGGFGIQTAPAAAKMAAGLILEENLLGQKLDHAIYSPQRF